MYMRVCVNLCPYTYIRARLYVYGHILAFACTYVYVHTHIYTRTRTQKWEWGEAAFFANTEAVPGETVHAYLFPPLSFSFMLLHRAGERKKESNTIREKSLAVL